MSTPMRHWFAHPQLLWLLLAVPALGLLGMWARRRRGCPLTHDYDHFREMVSEIDDTHLDRGLWTEEDARTGTRIGAGLVLAVEAHAKEAAGAQDILLLSDGDDPADREEKREEEWRLGI